MAVAFDVSSGNHGNGVNSLLLPAITTAGTNELILIGTHVSNSDTVGSITGGSLTFVQVGRLQAGTPSADGFIEVWRAFATSVLTAVQFTVNFGTGFPQCCAIVMAISGTDTTGTNGSGAIGANGGTSFAIATAASKAITTTRNNSLGIAFAGLTGSGTEVAGSGQTLRSQQTGNSFSTSTGLTQNAVTPSSGTSVTMNSTWTGGADAALYAVEILAPASVTLFNGAFGYQNQLPPELFMKPEVVGY